jgi:hypothetical protein
VPIAVLAVESSNEVVVVAELASELASDLARMGVAVEVDLVILGTAVAAAAVVVPGTAGMAAADTLALEVRLLFVAFAVVEPGSVVVVTADEMCLEGAAVDTVAEMKESAALAVESAAGFGSRRLLQGRKPIPVGVERV